MLLQKIYLNDHYRELNLNGEIYQVKSEGEPARFYVEAPPACRRWFEEREMLEGQGAQSEEVENSPALDPVIKVDLDPTPENVSKSEATIPPEWPESFYCPSHKREHRAGSSAYALCLEKHGDGSTAKATSTR